MMLQHRMPVHRAILRGLALAALLAAALPVLMAGTARAQGGAIDCRTLWSDVSLREWGDPGGDGSFPCVEYIPTPEGRRFQFGKPIRLYIPDWWAASPHPRAPGNTPEVIFKAMEKSMAALQGSVELYPITAVLLPTVYNQFESEEHWGAAAADARRSGVTFGQACPVSIYLNSVVDQNEDQIGEVVAHETFHCIQYSETYEQTRAPGAGWWMEATAVYFGDAMFECGTTDRWTARSYDPNQPLYWQVLAGSALASPLGYPSGIFFTNRADNGMFGIPQLINFIRRTPTPASGASQEQALAGQSNIGEMLHRYAEDFIDQSVRDCGSSVWLPPVEGPHEIAYGVTEIEVEAEPFTIKTASVDLQEDATYKIRAERDSTLSYGMVSYRNIEVQGGWSPLSDSEITYETGCDEEITLQFAVTTATGSGESYKAMIVIEEEEDETPGAVSISSLCGPGMSSRHKNDCRQCERVKNLPREEIDKCLVGHWRLAHGLWETEAGVIRAMSGASVSIEVDGNPNLVIDKSGTMSFSGFNINQKISAGDGSMTLSAFVNRGAGRWNARDGMLQTCSISVKQEDVEKTIKGPDVNMTFQTRTARKAHLTGGSFTYECSPSELKIVATGDFPGNTRPWWLYQRISPGNCP